MKEFIEMHWKAEWLRKYGLPDIGYPMPSDASGKILDSGGEISFAQILFWLQEFSTEQQEGWQELEPAMQRLAELLAPDDSREVLTAQGDTWFLELGPINLSSKIITIQRRDYLIAAIAPRQDFRLRVAAYHPLDAKTINYLFGLSALPDNEGNVCMRPNNWECALDQASHPMSAFYACERGESYISLWEYGLGVKADGTHSEIFRSQQQFEPLAVNLVAIQLGVYYMYLPQAE
jgi:hypothetical protein